MKVQILVTGGTFDKEYDLINGRLFFQDTHVNEIIELGRCTMGLDIKTLMMVDSLYMTPEDRELIAEECINCENNHIVITHGTDTMVETAQLLRSKKIDKTIVLTGALIPYKFGSSDGLFNMGSALAFAQSLPNGVYIVMHGKYFEANTTRKNKETGYFEELKL